MKWLTFKEELQAVGVTETDTGGKSYLTLPNRDTVRWVLPITDAKNWKTSLLLYSPNTWKGRLYLTALKTLPLPIIRRWQRQNLVHLNFESAVFLQNRQNLISAFYVGNEGADSKATVQLQKNGKPYAFLKFSQSGRIAQLFENEYYSLSRLGTFHNAVVPQVVQCGRSGEVYLFEATAVKTGTSKAHFKFEQYHCNFLLEMYEKSRIDSIERGIWYADISKKMKKLPSEDRWMGDIISRIQQKYGEKLPIGFVHGDFTPWNCIYEDGTLRVFDWEYAACPKPVFLDGIHFLLQPEFLRQQLSLGQACALLAPLSDYLTAIGCDSIPLTVLVQIYLIEQYTFYLMRSESVSYGERMILDRWQSVLKESEEKTDA